MSKIEKLLKKFNNIQYKNGVHSSTVTVYSYCNESVESSSTIGKLHISHCARPCNLDDERFVTYTLNKRIADSIEEMRSYLDRKNYKYKIHSEKSVIYGYIITILKDK